MHEYLPVTMAFFLQSCTTCIMAVHSNTRAPYTRYTLFHCAGTKGKTCHALKDLHAHNNIRTFDGIGHSYWAVARA